MIKLIVRQANWGILGSVFGFSIGFFVKIYLIDIVGIEQWGRYVSAQTFAGAMSTLLSFGIPWIIIKYIPSILDNDINKAQQLIRKIFRVSAFASCLFLVLTYFLSPFLDVYVYKEIDNFSLILLVVSINVPIGIFMGVITSLYRSVFRIKEIMLYGTFIIVPLRAVITYFTFMYTDNILYFVGIEIFTSFVSLGMLYYMFNKDALSIFTISKDNSFKVDSEIKKYGRKMYINSLVSFIAGQSLSFILSIMLPSSYIGVYSILLTVSGVALFLINNLNTIFAPAISKLYSEGKIDELSALFKKTTFIINLIAFPFFISIIIFSKDILLLFDDTAKLVVYYPYLYIVVFARVFRIMVGAAGSVLVMANLEKYELNLQYLKAVLINVLAIILILEYELLGVCVLFTISTFIEEAYRLIVIHNKLKINPFSKSFFLLILLSIPFIFAGMNINISFKLYHFIVIPILLYSFYALIFFKEIKLIYFQILKKE